ncbi:hypothetical protein [Asticcacaulis solisilvae]|uniref:hypothetical protein n=1 Tax=Asticcacaulis solisilvae TaxID=1217274 RepID=UPI003FD6EA64
MTSTPTIDPIIRARFKEAARRIIAKDRSARRTGASQNTIGEIERALVKAYLIGAGDLVMPSTAEKSPLAVTWETLPPRARAILDFMTFCLSERFPGGARKIDRLALADASDRRWHIRSADGTLSDFSFGESGVKALSRLGLIAEDPDVPTDRVVTEAGIETAKAYWERVDNEDPTLPLHSVRA